MIELSLVVVGVSIVIILSYFLFTGRTPQIKSMYSEEHEYERVGDAIQDVFYMRIPGIDKVFIQMLGDLIVNEGKIEYEDGMVDYGDKYGAVNVTEIVYDYFDSYFFKRWNLTVPLVTKIGSILWIPNSQSHAESSISKINSIDGKEMGRYYTVPSNIYGNPSRVSLDSNGNVWVGNRGTRTLVKIGLFENNQCKDKNGDGIIETSQDLNMNGIIGPSEILPFKEDECLLTEVFLGGNSYGNFDSGGVKAVCVDQKDNVYAGMFNDEKLFYVSKDGNILKEWSLSSYGITPYGCFVDSDGILWVSGVTTKKLLRFDPKTESFTVIDIGHVVYGISPCFNEDCLVINCWGDTALVKLNTSTNQFIFNLDKPELMNGRGVIVDSNENIYAVSSSNDLVVKYDENGVEISRAPTCDTPTGVGIDFMEKIWVTCLDSEIRRYNSSLVHEKSSDFGTGHYVYNFFTSYNVKPIFFQKSISFGYIHENVERIRTFLLKQPLPGYTGEVIDVEFKQW